MELRFQADDDCVLHASIVGRGPAVVLLHGGGPDRRSLLPLAWQLRERHTVILPDIRGYGASRCPHPSMHTWGQYTRDLLRMLVVAQHDVASLVGTGLGATLSLRAARDHRDHVARVVLISLEDIEDDTAKRAETALMDAFAEVALAEGLEAAWGLYLADLQPLIRALVLEALPRADASSIAAAAHIGHDRAFTSVDDLAVIGCPVLVIAGDDQRHPRALAEAAAAALPAGQLASVRLRDSLRTADDLGSAFAPVILDFLAPATT